MKEMISRLTRNVRDHFNQWGGLYIASIFWAFIFRQIGRLSQRSLEIGGTDYWSWLLFTYFALATGWVIGNRDTKDSS